MNPIPEEPIQPLDDHELFAMARDAEVPVELSKELRDRAESGPAVSSNVLEYRDLLRKVEELNENDKVYSEHLSALRDIDKAGFNVGEEIKKMVKSRKNLEMVIARIYDKVNEAEERGKLAHKQACRDYNLLVSQVMELAARQNSTRTERTWNPGTASSRTFDREKYLREMLSIHGVLKKEQKTTMVDLWVSKAGVGGKSSLLSEARNFLRNVGNGDVQVELSDEAKRFLAKDLEGLMKLSEEQAIDLVTDVIPTEEWLLFMRTGLELPESDIKEAKRCCKPTREQLHQVAEAEKEWNRRNGLDE